MYAPAMVPPGGPACASTHARTAFCAGQHFLSGVHEKDSAFTVTALQREQQIYLRSGMETQAKFLKTQQELNREFSASVVRKISTGTGLKRQKDSRTLTKQR